MASSRLVTPSPRHVCIIWANSWCSISTASTSSQARLEVHPVLLALHPHVSGLFGPVGVWLIRLSQKREPSQSYPAASPGAKRTWEKKPQAVAAVLAMRIGWARPFPPARQSPARVSLQQLGVIGAWADPPARCRVRSGTPRIERRSRHETNGHRHPLFPRLDTCSLITARGQQPQNCALTMV